MDLEKGIKKEAIGADPDARIPVMASGEGKGELPISDLRVAPAVIDHGGVTAPNMNPTGKKSLRRCWLIVAGSVMFLTNCIQAAPKYQLIPMEPMVIFTMFMCAIFLVFLTMKKM